MNTLNTLNILELSLTEIYERYGIVVDKESLGYDRGLLFNSVALKFSKTGKFKVTEYLPSGYLPYKEYDVIIKVKEFENGK